MTRLTSSTTTSGTEMEQLALIFRSHSNQCTFLQAILSLSTSHHLSKVEYSEETRSPPLGSSSNSKHQMTTKRMEMSVSSKATTDQQLFDLQMAQTEQAVSLLPSTPLSLLIRPDLMTNTLLLVPWAIGWEVRTRLPLKPSKVSRAKSMLLVVPVCLILLLRTIGLL